jgi:GAF domain-containing protein
MTYDTYDATELRPLTPVDHEVPRRLVRLRELGLGARPEQDFDEFAQRLAQSTGAPYAMVNFISDSEQYFAGLYTPSSARVGASRQGGEAPASAEPGRTMSREHGYCPHVVVRRRALVLEDVCDYPRFAGNPVVDEIGIRSYLGAPLIDRTGTALGTICVIDTEPRPWGRPGLETIKSMAAEVMELIHRRERHL